MNNREIKCKIIASHLNYIHEGKIYDEYNQEVYYKYAINQKVYCVYESYWGKYKVKDVMVYGVVFTNCPSYQLSNGWVVLEDDLFSDVDEAINYCEKLNNRKKYKV